LKAEATDNVNAARDLANNISTKAQDSGLAFSHRKMHEYNIGNKIVASDMLQRLKA